MHQHYSELDSKGIAQASEQTLMDMLRPYMILMQSA